MKVIFLQDVPDVAKAGEIKEVADGYGRNFLIPKNLAVLATTSATISLETQRKIIARKQRQLEADITELGHQLEGKQIIIEARAGAQERLFGSITSADIASEIKNATGLVVDKKRIELAEPIRQLGNYEVAIKLAKDVVPKIRVIVMLKETG